MKQVRSLLKDDSSDDILGGNGDIPWWVRAAYRYGAPIVIALGLTWFLASGVKGDIASLQQGEAEMRREHQELGFYLRGICFNTAQTEAQRSGCFPPQ
jgi:hypothetical protein